MGSPARNVRLETWPEELSQGVGPLCVGDPRWYVRGCPAQGS